MHCKGARAVISPILTVLISEYRTTRIVATHGHGNRSGRCRVFYLISHAPSNDETFKSTQQKLAKLFDSDPKVSNLPPRGGYPVHCTPKGTGNIFITRSLLG